MEEKVYSKLVGKISDMEPEEGELTLCVNNIIDFRLEYFRDIEDEVEMFWTGCSVVVDVELTGWADMPYPHLTHDVPEGRIHGITGIENYEG